MAFGDSDDDDMSFQPQKTKEGKALPSIAGGRKPSVAAKQNAKKSLAPANKKKIKSSFDSSSDEEDEGEKEVDTTKTQTAGAKMKAAQNEMEKALGIDAADATEEHEEWVSMVCKKVKTDDLNTVLKKMAKKYPKNSQDLSPHKCPGKPGNVQQVYEFSTKTEED